jgi:hypothetical protein
MLIPDEVRGLRSVRAVAAGLMHNCALAETSAVKCWGGNTNGGYFTTRAGASTTTPIDVKVVP